MRIVVVGATSAIAEHCCRLWVQREAADLTLVVRDIAKGERMAADLRLRSPQSSVALTTVDFMAPAAITALAESIAAGGPIDAVLIAHGVLPAQEQCQDDLAFCREIMEVNAISPVLFAEAFAAILARAGRGTIAIIGSVAGDRGRKANYVYGASKGLVARYAEGMEHRFAGTDVRIVLVKPGPTDTPMAAPYKAQGWRLAPVEEVAHGTVEAMRRGTPVAYLPRRWKFIMLVARTLPDFLFNRIDF